MNAEQSYYHSVYVAVSGWWLISVLWTLLSG